MMWLVAIVPTLGLFGYPSERMGGGTPGRYPQGDEAAAAIFTAHNHPARVSRYWYDADLYSLESLFERRCWGEHNGIDRWHSIETFDYETAFARAIAPPARHLMEFNIPHFATDYPFIGFDQYFAAQYYSEHPYGREYSFCSTSDYQYAYCPFNLDVTRILLPPQLLYQGSTNGAPRGIKYANIWTRLMSYGDGYGHGGGGLLELIDRGQWMSQFTGQSIYHHLSDPYLQDIDQDEFYWAGFFPHLNDGSQAYTTFSGVSGFQDSPNALGDGPMLKSWWSWDNCDSGLCGVRWTTNTPVRASMSPVNSSFIVDKWWDVSALMGQYDATDEGQREHGKWRDTISKRGGTNNYTGASVDISTTNKRRRYFANDAFGVAVTNDVNWYTPWASRILWHPRAVANELLDRLDWVYTSRQSYRPIFENFELWGIVALRGNATFNVSGSLRADSQFPPFGPLTLHFEDVDCFDSERQKDNYGHTIPWDRTAWEDYSNRTYRSEIADFSVRSTSAQGRVVGVPAVEITNGIPCGISLGNYYFSSLRIEDSFIMDPNIVPGVYYGTLEFVNSGGREEMTRDYNRADFTWSINRSSLGVSHFPRGGEVSYYLIPTAGVYQVGFSNVVATVDLRQAIECINASIQTGLIATNMVLQRSGFPATYPAWQYAGRKVERVKSNYMLAGWHGAGSLDVASSNRTWVFSWRDVESVNNGDNQFVNVLNRDSFGCCSQLTSAFREEFNMVDSPLSWDFYDYQYSDPTYQKWVDYFLRVLFEEIAYAAQCGWYWSWMPWVDEMQLSQGGYVPLIDFEVTLTEGTSGREVSIVYFDPAASVPGVPLRNNELYGRLIVGMDTPPGWAILTNAVEGASARCDLSGFSATHYNWTTQPVKKGQP